VRESPEKALLVGNTDQVHALAKPMSASFTLEVSGAGYGYLN
jgi:hypothetical protein